MWKLLAFVYQEGTSHFEIWATSQALDDDFIDTINWKFYRVGERVGGEEAKKK